MNTKTISTDSDINLRAYRAELMKNIALIDEELEKRRLAALKGVEVIKLDHGHFIFSHPTFGEFEAKNVAYASRFRVWKRVQGVRGLKRGPVVINEALVGVSGIRELVAQGKL